MLIPPTSIAFTLLLGFLVALPSFGIDMSLATPLVPTVRGIYADGDMVIILFDAAATTKEGRPYRNTYTWYFQMVEGKAANVIAFFDTRDFDEFWMRVSPTS